MATFIKAGFWETLCQKCTGYRGWFNLDKFVEDKINASGGGYKVYTALLTQEGTDAPVATVLENTLGANITYTRLNEGDYNIVTDGIFPDGKTWASAISTNYNGNQVWLAIGRISDTECHLYSNTPLGIFVDMNTEGDYVSIEIRVYP